MSKMKAALTLRDPGPVDPEMSVPERTRLLVQLSHRVTKLVNAQFLHDTWSSTNNHLM